jgi:hypothetical protein
MARRNRPDLIRRDYPRAIGNRTVDSPGAVRIVTSPPVPAAAVPPSLGENVSRKR